MHNLLVTLKEKAKLEIASYDPFNSEIHRIVSYDVFEEITGNKLCCLFNKL